VTRLRVGTKNPDKLREFREILEPLGFTVVGIDDLEDFEVIEDGTTFAANAAKKALAVVAATGGAAVADDSGLVVDALNGEPGVHSARYAGVAGPSKDAKNRQKLLAALEGVALSERTARFVCALAYARPNEPPQLFCGVLEGVIGTRERGKGGFGYDALFEIPTYGKTAAEVTPIEKNAVSHRGQALRALAAFLAARCERGG
jgi:XTP/dITP diphosphohydrolase